MSINEVTSDRPEVRDQFYELYRVGEDMRCRTPAGSSKWAYDIGENCNIMSKFLYLVEHATGGFCYLRLMILLPVFDRIKLELFKQAIDYLKEDAGRFPIGKDLMVRLASLNMIIEQDLLGVEDPAKSVEFDAHIYEKMLCNHHWFRFDINTDVIHIESCEWIKDNGPESRVGPNIQDDQSSGRMNYSSRLIVVLLGASNQQVGGTIVDLNELFDEMSEVTDYTMTPDQLGEFARTDSVVDQVERHVRQMEESNRQPDSTYQSESDISSSKNDTHAQIILDQHEMIHQLKKRLDLETASNRKSRKALSDLVKREQTRVKPQSVLRAESVCPETEFTPDDSVSNFGEKKRFMKPNGTVITTVPRYSHKVETLVEVPHLQPTKDVVIGYQKTIQMQEAESTNNSKIHPINGLANPFRDNRLNLLMHFHTAVETNLPINDENGYRQSLMNIVRYRAKSPSEELSKLIVGRTFDFESGSVVANPFKLPFIEVGMLISDNCLAGCFSLLKLEFKTLWFNSMKSLYVPRFHKDFRTYSETSSSKPHRERSTRNKQPSLFTTRTPSVFSRTG